ncbi:MAG: hypothetical protein ABIH65_03255 [Nanoarchaeota archaeon]
MRKTFWILGVVLSLLIVGFFVSAQLETNEANAAQSSDLSENLSAEVFEKPVSTQAQEYVLNFAEKRGIFPSEISFVKEVDFDALPKEVNIENVGDNNLAIYEVSYDNQGIEDKVYVVTYSVEKLSSQGDLIIAQDKRQFLNFGFSGMMNSSGFLKTATEVETNLEKGYVMVRDGSITAVSTNLEVLKSNPGDIEIIVYVNGNQVGFGNLLSTETAEVKKDYDVQSKGIVNFKAGDVISVYLKSNGEAVWGDVITILEITTTN